MVWHCIKESAHFHPDIYLGFASSACAITSFIFRKPCVLMDDTEHNAMNHKLYLPFCSMVLTPYYFQKTLGKKQQYFKAYVEQLYLYSEYFMPHGEVLERLDLKPREYVLVRYIAYDAHHDFVAHPLSEEKKKKIVKELSKKYKVLVSLEKDADDPFYEPYKIKIRPEEMHDIEAQAKFMITEGATMASEAFVMGVPYLYMNPLKVGNVNEQVQRCPSFAFQSVNENEINKIIKKMEMLSMDNAKQKVYIESRTVNPTQYLIETINRFVNRHD